MAATFNAPVLLTQGATPALTRPAVAAAGGAAPSSDVGAATAVNAHEAATDPHPQYLTEAEADALYAPLVGGGAVAMGVATVTISPAKFGAAEATVVDASMLPTSLVTAQVMPSADFDADDLEGVQVVAAPATGSCVFTLIARGPLVGSYRLVYHRG